MEVGEVSFRMLSEALPQIIWITRADGSNIYFNQRWMDYTGLTLEESLGNGSIKAFHPDDAQRAREAWQKATTTISEYSIECRLRRTDGVYRWWLIRGIPLKNPDGSVLKWFGTCTDIEQLKQAEALISQHADLLNETHDAIIVRDLEHRIEFWNRAAERIYGWTADEARDKVETDLLYLDVEQLKVPREIFNSTGSWNGELRHVTKTGAEVIVDSRWTLLKDSAGNTRAILAINSDITERKKIEQQFLRAQRLESIGTLAGGIAHDLNNLLAPITMAVALLKQYNPDPRNLHLVESIEASAIRGASLVKQVLAFARGVEGTRVPMRVGDILNEAYKICVSTFPKNIEIQIRPAKDLWMIMADPTQINQVLVNLCVNARDAMPNGGKIELTAKNIEIDAQYSAMNRGSAPGKYAMIEIADEGTGISKAIIDRIFEPFFTTKEIGKGTGLGLSTVAGIVRGHGGFINVYSEVGHGTVFKVYLPANLDDESTFATPSVEEQLPRGNGELVMIVDDEQSILDVSRQTLEAFGYKVVTAEDGAHAIASYATGQDKIAVVLTDIMMPLMDGITLIAALRRINPKVRVIAASGIAGDGHATRAAAMGVRHFIAKPYTADVMLNVIKKALEEPSASGSRSPFLSR